MKVFIIGTGNVAKSLGAAIFKSGHKITGVLGRSEENAKVLAKKFKCASFTKADQIPHNSDFYLIAVKDDAIGSIVKSLPETKGIFLHTSGTVPLDIFKTKSKKGVLYPVDSITGKYNFSFKNVPICIEAGDESTLKKLLLFVRTLSNKIFLLNSPQRAKLHIAAVITNNFTNHLLGIATEIIDKEHLPHELLFKLAQTTLKNAFEHGPLQSQTGPAKRNDAATIRKHLDLLKANKDHVELYKLITRQITDVHNKK